MAAVIWPAWSPAWMTNEKQDCYQRPGSWCQQWSNGLEAAPAVRGDSKQIVFYCCQRSEANCFHTLFDTTHYWRIPVGDAPQKQLIKLIVTWTSCTWNKRRTSQLPFCFVNTIINYKTSSFQPKIHYGSSTSGNNRLRWEDYLNVLKSLECS